MSAQKKQAMQEKIKEQFPQVQEIKSEYNEDEFEDRDDLSSPEDLVDDYEDEIKDDTVNFKLTETNNLAALKQREEEQKQKEAQKAKEESERIAKKKAEEELA